MARVDLLHQGVDLVLDFFGTAVADASTSILLLLNEGLDLSVVLIKLASLGGAGCLVGALLVTDLLLLLNELLPSVVLGAAFTRSGTVYLFTSSFLFDELAEVA